jgi:hypothetical protein
MEELNGGTAANRSGAPAKVSLKRKVAIGCFTAWLGFASGAMVAALLSKLAAFVTRAPECSEVPSCNWYIWAGVGGVIGAVTLPFMVLWVLGKPAKAGEHDNEF